MQNEHESTDIIRIEHLNKTFGDVKAVRDLGFCVKKGELFAFLGVNGAGKSTTISILCGQLSKDSGTVQIKGIDNQRAGEQTKRLIGVVFQDSVLDKPLTVKENLKSRAALYGITGQAFEKRLQELLDILDFGDYLNRPVTKLSGGQRRRIDIARALLHRPEILILDEPTTGLDPMGRDEILDQIASLHETRGITIILVSHSMEDIAKYVERIIVMNHGVKTFDDAPKKVFAHYKELEAIGLAAPQITYIMHALKEKGLDVDTSAINVDEATTSILRALWKKEEDHK